MNENLPIQVKAAIVSILLANAAMAADNTNTTVIDIFFQKYWVLILALLAMVGYLLYQKPAEDPIEVMGLVYDRETHQLELTLKNTGGNPYQLRSALRLIRPTEQTMPENEDGLTMAAGNAETNRTLYDLLCEDKTPMEIGPQEIRTVTYNVMLPQEYINLESMHNVEVHINYGENQPPKQKEQKQKNTAKTKKPTKTKQPEIQLPQTEEVVADITFRPPFKMKTDTGEIIAEPILLQELADAIKIAPKDAIHYHLREGNDFADWVEKAVEDMELAAQLRTIQQKDMEKARNQLVKILETKKEKLPDPTLTPVDHTFLLKTNHETVINEITLLGDLSKAIENSPISAVAFHLRDGNDFADWVEKAVGDTKLANKMRKVNCENILDAREQLIQVISQKIEK